MNVPPNRPLGEVRDMILLDHLINVVDQLHRLADIIRKHGIAVPDDIGVLGPADEETIARYTLNSIEKQAQRKTEVREMLKQRFPDLKFNL